jgi:hypothetical protein
MELKMLRKVTAVFVMPVYPLVCLCVRMEQSAPSLQIFMKFYIRAFTKISPPNSSLVKYDKRKYTSM